TRAIESSSTSRASCASCDASTEDVPQACNSNIGLSTARFNAGPPVRVTVISRAGDSKAARPLGTSDETGTSIRSARNSTTSAVESGSISAPPLVQRPRQLVGVPDRRSPRPRRPDLAYRRTPGSLRDRPRPPPQIRKHLRVLQQRLSTSRIDLHPDTHPTTRFNEIRPPGLNPNGPNV